MKRPIRLLKARLLNALLAGFVAVGLLAHGSGALAATGKVALTFDDLPALSLFNDQPYVNHLNDMLLRGLKRHHLPAIGFVNESKLDAIDRTQQIANLDKWLSGH
jgi:peptidoglycan/xylan/chitin deacetylase (PgdA/CDA1 family)